MRTAKTILFALCLAACTTATAQSAFTNRTELGFKYGWNRADMHYSHKMYNMYKHRDNWQNQFGFFMKSNVSDHFAIRPELTFINRGTRMKFEEINYRIEAKYFDLRLPLMISFAPHSAVNPYMFITPEVCIVRKGEITFNSPQTDKITTDLSLSNIRNCDVAVLAGLGLEVPIRIGQFRFSLAAEAGYSLGLLNTFADDELDGDAYVLNPSPFTYTPQGRRTNRGIEAALVINLPLSNLNTVPKPKKRPVVVETEPEPIVEVFEYEIKDCYSFEEMYSFVKNGVDISDKRICVFDMKFQFGSAKLLRSSEKYLDNVVGMMKAFPRMRITINGHTDNIGTEEANQKLSEQRAQSVFDYLVKHGIEPSRMSCHGYGLNYPIDTNATEAGRARNRRVEIEVTRIK